MRQYTTEDLILYLYKETSGEETKAIEKALETDWVLKEKFDALNETKQCLEMVATSPRQQSVNAILDYAKASVEIAQP